MCSDALTAAGTLIETFAPFHAARRTAGARTLDFGVAIHLGEVVYGNIGTAERLDFTVVGAAVNEASRIEGMCRPLQRKVLISDSFQEAVMAGSGRMVSVGFHALRGIREPKELFTIAGA